MNIDERKTQALAADWQASCDPKLSDSVPSGPASCDPKPSDSVPSNTKAGSPKPSSSVPSNTKAGGPVPSNPEPSDPVPGSPVLSNTEPSNPVPEAGRGKTGLVMEGGAMRGMFTAGVIDVMMEEGIGFDGAAGVSAGAAFGCNIKSKQIGRAIRYNMNYCNDSRYCSIRNLIKTGNLFSKDFAYGKVPAELDPFDYDAYMANPMDFFVVCTDIETGKPVYHNYEGSEASGFDWIRASASMPLVSEIVEIDGQKLLDGGISDSMPLRFLQSQGYEKNVVILTQPADYRKEKNKALALMKLKYRKYPNLIDTIANRHIEYNETLEYIREQEALGKILVIRPDEKLPVSRIEKNPQNLKKTYEIGREIALRQLEKIRDFCR